MTAALEIPGVIEIPASVYHADDLGDPRPALSKSIIAELVDRTPAHARARHPKLNPEFERKDEAKFDVGTGAHALMLERDGSTVHVVAANDWKTKAAQQERDAARFEGKTPLLARTWAETQRMVAAARAQLDAADATIFTGGKPEQTLVWEEHGVLCKARCDWLDDSLRRICDYKTTSGSAAPEGWTRNRIYEIGADLQAAFYLRGLAAVSGNQRGGEFVFVVQETFPPYAVSFVSAAPDVLAFANRKIDFALATWRRCLETDVWPAYPAEITYATLPPWMEDRWYARELREEGGVAA